MDQLPPYDPASAPRLSLPCPNYLAQNRFCGLRELCIFSHRPEDYILWNLVPQIDSTAIAWQQVTPASSYSSSFPSVTKGEKRPASVTPIDQPPVKKSTAELIKEFRSRQEASEKKALPTSSFSSAASSSSSSYVSKPLKSALKKAAPPAAPSSGKVLLKIPPEITASTSGNDRVPLPVRQSILDKLYLEYLIKHNNDKKQAAIAALNSETEIYEKSTSKIVYQNFGAHAISNLKKENSS